MRETGSALSASAALGPGVVVWESNRTGNYRIFLRDLAGEEVRQLSPDEPGRDHCCALFSPDGSRLVYLSLPEGKAGYQDGKAAGELRLVTLAGGAVRVVAERARTYAEHRAAVWWGDGELVHIDGEGHTIRVDLATGRREPLTSEPRADFGWLLDPTGRFATTGDPTFSRYDPGSRRIETAPRLGGCQPVFSQDGRYGVWSAGAGGPIARIDLESRAQATLLARNDRRTVDGFGYLYFPMPSRDGTVLAFAASEGGHDHFAADYEVFAVATDPATLEPVGPVVRLTRSPAVDRFPDIWLAPLPLGRLGGETPLAVQLEAPEPGNWRWELGDGARAEGVRVEHTYAAPGLYEVVARVEERELRGRVAVRPPAAAAAPPVELGHAWPLSEEGLRFLWPDADTSGRAWRDGELETAADLLSPEGRAWVDGAGRLALAGGRFTLAPELAGSLNDAVQATNELTLELEIEPWSVAEGARGPILSLANAPVSRSFALWQEGERLLLYLRTADTGPVGAPPVEVGRLEAARPIRLAVTFTPGRLSSYLDGTPFVEEQVVPGDFFHWRAVHLAVGGEERGRERWRGWVSSVRIAARRESSAEIAESHRRRRAERPSPAPPLAAELRLVSTSEAPDLAAIAPYRESLLVQELELVLPLAGQLPSGRLRVARWAHLAGERLPAADARAGDRLVLRLQPLADEKRAQSLYLADTLPEAWDLPVFLDVGLDLDGAASGE